MTFASVAVTDDRAQTLLTEYFTYRSASFPVVGGYTVTLPKPEVFTPPSGEFVLALDDGGDAVGCGGIRRLPDDVLGGEPRIVWEVKHLWVREAGRGTGTGRALLAELERRAAGWGAQCVVLDTNSSLIAANRLYRSSGYEAVPPYNDNPNATHHFAKAIR